MLNRCFNWLAYADDLVLLAPSLHGLQYLINVLISAADDVSLNVNTKKTVTMIFNPTDKYKRLSSTFPQFSMRGSCLSYVACFKYLGHIIDNSMHDDSDIKCELKGLFARPNLLNRRFWQCTRDVKLLNSTPGFDELFTVICIL